MYQYRIDDMSCNHCAITITDAIKAADSQANVSIDLEKHQVSVDSSLAQQAVTDLIVKAGYTPVAC